MNQSKILLKIKSAGIAVFLRIFWLMSPEKVIADLPLKWTNRLLEKR